ncbi:GNAT family N-acetyltransferase [Clostridium thermarum]|uniref:GNAT family N-acetyltransferase n=1 Tax=Clostridium thermarum TaxID=1716543 RepID=UPI0011244B32|nr:GNAT family protein [Clostridium thermarum]
MKILETERMILRPWKIEDLEDFYEYAKNPNVGPYAGWEPHGNKEVTLRILQSFIEKDEVRAIVYRENGKVIGSIGTHVDRKRGEVKAKMIGYVLSEHYWGRGLMPEAVNRVIKYLFEEENLELISCYHFPFNFRSKKVIEKCNFKYEGILRKASQIYDGSIQDDVCYSITKEDYFYSLSSVPYA